MTRSLKAPDRESLVAGVHEASAGLARFGDALVTESVPYEAEPAGEERTVVVTLSTADRDRHGDVLEPEGAHLENFRRNPVVLFAHRHDLPAVGKALWVRALPGRLVAKIAFARTRLGEELHSLYARGYMKAWSVGFIPVEWERLESDEKRPAGVRVKSWELLEVSAVPVPANPEALSKAIREGEVTEPVLVKSLEPVETTPRVEGGLVATLAALLSAHSERLDRIEKGLAELRPAGPAQRDPAELLELVARAAAEAFDRKVRALSGRMTGRPEAAARGRSGPGASD